MYAGYFRFFSIPLAVGGYGLLVHASSRTFYNACSTPLCIACMRGHADVVRLLLQEGSSRTLSVGESDILLFVFAPCMEDGKQQTLFMTMMSKVVIKSLIQAIIREQTVIYGPDHGVAPFHRW